MQLPEEFGKYTLVERLAVGGMAEVFLAYSKGAAGFAKAIALKRILPALSTDQEFINMFTDEARIAGGLRHPHIGQVHEFGEVDGVHFLAMEYIAGKDLHNILKRCEELEEKVPIEMACSILIDICEALDYAHHKCDAYGKPLGIVHRDCSPQNIFVSLEGEVKLIDFGIAKAKKRVARTMNGVLKGKVRYTSPEQVRGDPVVDRRSDIFVLGSVLYELATGHPAFGGASDYATMESVREVNCVPAAQRNPQIPAQVLRVIERAMRSSPDDRYQSCSEMRAELSAFLMSRSKPTTHSELAALVKRLFPNARDNESKRMQAVRKGVAVEGVPASSGSGTPPVRAGTEEPIEDMSEFANTYHSGIHAPNEVGEAPVVAGTSAQLSSDGGNGLGRSVFLGAIFGLVIAGGYVGVLEFVI